MYMETSAESLQINVANYRLLTPPASIRTADRYQVVVHIDEARLRRSNANK